MAVVTPLVFARVIQPQRRQELIDGLPLFAQAVLEGAARPPEEQVARGKRPLTVTSKASIAETAIQACLIGPGQRHAAAEVSRVAGRARRPHPGPRHLQRADRGSIGDPPAADRLADQGTQGERQQQ